MSTIASQITSITIVYSTVYLDADQRKHQRSASLAFVRGIHRRPVNSPHKWPVTRKMFPFDDVIMESTAYQHIWGVPVIHSPRITGPLWGESTGHQWFSPKAANNAELWNFFLSWAWQAVKQTVEVPVVWNSMTLMWQHYHDEFVILQGWGLLKLRSSISP